MRKDVKKFLFIGNVDDKGQFFKKAQALGLVHFIQPASDLKNEVPEDVMRLTAAIKVLRGLPPMEQEENYQQLDVDALVQQILSLHDKKEKLLEEERVLSLEIARIEAFGDFSLEDLAFIEREGKKKIQFFVARSSLFQDQPIPESLLYIASDNDLDYYMAVNERSVAYEKMIEIKIERSLSQLKERLREVEQESRQVERQLKSYGTYNEFLHHSLVDKLNHYHLYNAQTYVKYAMDGLLFAVEGWVPANKVLQVEELTDHLHVYAEEVAVESADVVPTYLENRGFGRLGEDLVHIYDTPSASDKDPSKWVLWCFTLFFAFIIGDAGYGLVYLAIALFLRYKYPNLKGLGKRALNIFTVLCVGCIVWGTLITSFFGMQIDINNPIRKFSLVQWLSTKKIAYHIAHQDSSYDYWTKRLASSFK